MKDIFKDFWYFNKRERNGILVLLILIIGMLIFIVIIRNAPPPKPVDFTKFKNEIAAFEQSLKAAEEQQQFTSAPYEKKQEAAFDFTNLNKSIAQSQLQPFYFNPNNLDAAKWQELGLTEKQIKTIKNYEAKGGKFRKKEDFKKMYCISEHEYQILEPYIIIPDSLPSVFPKPSFPKYEKNIGIIDINIADTITLRKLKGIGAGFARRIVSYRNKLGGFINTEQLLEIWGFTAAMYDSIKDNITINNRSIRKININDAEIDDLKKHPYIDFYLAQAIVSYRNKHGQYQSIQEIKSIGMVYQDLFLKLEPYLCTQ